jgi:hypothetical protein
VRLARVRISPLNRETFYAASAISFTSPPGKRTVIRPGCNAAIHVHVARAVLIHALNRLICA